MLLTGNSSSHYTTFKVYLNDRFMFKGSPLVEVFPWDWSCLFTQKTGLVLKKIHIVYTNWDRFAKG